MTNYTVSQPCYCPEPLRRRLCPASIFRPLAGCRRGPADAAAATATVDQGLPCGVGRGRKRRSDPVWAALQSAPRWRPRGRCAHPERAVAVLAALRRGRGRPDRRPPPLAARHTAPQLRRNGLAETTTQMRASSPPWLAEELTGSCWASGRLSRRDGRSGDAQAPSSAELARLAAPLGVCAAVDDPIHPLRGGVDWAATARTRRCAGDAGSVRRGRLRLGAACLAALANASR